MDLAAASPLPARKALTAVAGLCGLVLLGVIGSLTGWALVALLGCVTAGAGLTYLSGLPLSVEERLAFGAVIGAVVVNVLGFLLALAFGLTLASVLLAIALALAASAPGWQRGRKALGAEVGEMAKRWRLREPWPLWLLLAVCWPFTIVLLSRAYTYTAQGLIAGNPGVYADWAAHLTYAGSFAYGHNFPPEFPVDPGHRMSYPFMVDFFAASLVPLGTTLTSAVVLTSGFLGLAFPAVMYLAGLRLLGSRGGAALAVLVFTLSGGLGFLYLVQDIDRKGPSVFVQLPRLYTQDVERNYQWLNPVLAYMIPQRSVLFGFSLALLSAAILWLARRREAWLPFAFAGVLAGLTPAFHLHAYGTIVALAAFWAVLTRRRAWVAFFAPALLLGVPALLFLISPGTTAVRTQIWWLANSGGHHDGAIWFWIKNTGLLIPVMAAAFLWRGLLPPRLALHLAPIWLWFLLPNFWLFQPWDWDNTKFFAYWALFGSLPAGALLARLLSRGHESGAIAVLTAALLMLSGVLDLARTLDPAVSSAAFTSAAGVDVAGWVRGHTEPDAVFLVAPVHNEPIPALAGRRVVAGYGGWLWTYGLQDWGARTEDAGRMLKGDPSTPGLVRRYGVRYVVLGPQELGGNDGASKAYWDRAADSVYSNTAYTVYRVR